MKKGCIFDLDGTLVDSVPDIIVAFNQALSNLNYNFSLDIKQARRMIGGGVATLIKRAFTHFNQPIQESQVNEIYTEFLSQYQPILYHQSKLYPNVEKTLHKLSQQGLQLGVCTNKPYLLSKALLKGMGIDNYFNVCIGGDSYPVKKPHPRPLLGAIEKINCTKKNIIYVGDSQVDYQTAQAIKADFIFLSFGYNNGFTPPKDTRVCHDFSEIIPFFC